MRYPAHVPYRIDIGCPPPNAVDALVQLGALDIELLPNGLAAILPDGVTRDMAAGALGPATLIISEAVARDSGSVWLLNPRPVRVGGVLIASPEMTAPTGALRLTDSPAFGTGHHPTTALCIEAIETILSSERERFETILDVGTGSGILALSALMMGVPQAVGLDIDAEALKAAAENARLNHMEHRLLLVLGGPDVVDRQWPLVVANVLAAPLIAMAPSLVRRLSSGGRLILSGIASSLESEVRQAYRHLGIRHIETETRGGWTVLIAHAPW